MVPGSGYSAPAVPATMICRSGRTAATRAAAARNMVQCRFTSCSRLPGNRPIEPEHPPRFRPRWRRRPVLQGMPDERGGDAALAEEFLLERQDDGQLIHRRELAHALGPPRPHLRCDVVQHGNAGGGSGRGGTEVIARVVDEDHQIVAPCREGLLDPI